MRRSVGDELGDGGDLDEGIDKDDFAGGGGQRDVGCGRGGRSLCQDEASSWGDISSIVSAMDSENIFD